MERLRINGFAGGAEPEDAPLIGRGSAKAASDQLLTPVAPTRYPYIPDRFA